MESISVVQGSCGIRVSITKPFGSAIALILLNNQCFHYLFLSALGTVLKKKFNENVLLYVGI